MAGAAKDDPAPLSPAPGMGAMALFLGAVGRPQVVVVVGRGTDSAGGRAC